MPKKVYASEEERQAARKEQNKKAAAARRAKIASIEGKEIKTRRQFKTEEERNVAKIENERKKYKNKKEKREKERKVWTPHFVGIDGESFVTGELLPDGTPKQAYCLLLRHDRPELYNPDGLDTWDCLNYLTSKPTRGAAYVGYFLNFDFEWILKDVSQEEYKALQHGETVSICSDEFRVQWFVRKKLVVYRCKQSAWKKEPVDRDLNKDFFIHTFQDTSGFFQSSFVDALKKWGFAEDPRLSIITSGKAARGGFRHEDYKEVSTYNAMEMELLEELMLKVYDSFQAGYTTTGLKWQVNASKWAGPGIFANDFLKQTFWTEEHEPPSAELAAHFAKINKTSFGNDAALFYPFSLSYYGGRIELAGIGKFGTTYNYDINSAYPYALSLLPRFKPEDFKLYEYVGSIADEETKALLSRRLMGMYGVSFNFPADWSWYPFPVRSMQTGTPNVYYPRQGRTNIMSPELFAALDTLTEEELQYIHIEYAFVLEESDGYGDALKRMDVNKLCTTARKTLEMADFRLKCKDALKRIEEGNEEEGDSLLAMAEKALKLILNSLYGKTVQQIGSHKYYNDFASAWITSTCRALLWRALAPERTTTNVLMTMTDGVYSLVPLKFAEDRLTMVLGDWEKGVYTYFETFKAGIYRYEKKKKMEYRVRGFLAPTIEEKERLFDTIWTSVSRGTIGAFPSKMFLPRNLALSGWRREPWIRQFFTDSKIVESELKAKRVKNDGTKWLIPEGRENVFFRPKGEFDFNDSIGYALDFENSKVFAKDEEDIERALAEYDATLGIEDYYN